MQLTSVVFTDTGGRAFNEDYYDEMTLEQGYCFVMADGCGHHGAGDLAAKIFCSAFLTQIKIHLESKEGRISVPILEYLVEHTKDILCDELERVGHPEARTTCAIVWIDQERMFTAHVGDTRVYRLSAQGSIWHTRDHTLAAEMQAVFYARVMTNASERHILLKSLGVGKPAEPTVHCFEPLEKGDTIVLCTDGFWEHMTQEEWRVLARTPSLEETLPPIRNRLFASDIVYDNMTAQVIRHIM